MAQRVRGTVSVPLQGLARWRNGSVWAEPWHFSWLEFPGLGLCGSGSCETNLYPGYVNDGTSEVGNQLLSPDTTLSDAGIQIRDARPTDAAAVLAIYRPHVEQSAVSFELTVPGVDELVTRIARAQARWSWLIAEIGGVCAGYAYGTALREREAYRWSVEVSAYVHPAHQRRGIATALYQRLLARLQERGFCQAFACIALPNPSSVAMHQKFGFNHVGAFRSVGRKFGRWHDVAWMQLELRSAPPPDSA